MNETNKDIVVIVKDTITTVKYETLTKDDIVAKSKIVEEAVASGYMDSIDVFIFIKKMQAFAEELKTRIQPHAAGDLRLGKGEKYERFGTEVTERDGGKYDYSTCNNPVWDAYKEQLDEIAAQMKSREVYLKALNKPKEIMDEDSGETFTIHPRVKLGGMSIIVKIK